MKNVPIYKHDFMYAIEHDERAEWSASFVTDVECRDAINSAITKYDDRMYLASDSAKEVIAAFGAERVAYVLANTVKCISATDVRISIDNRKWANSLLPVVPSHSHTFIVQAHPDILNLFIQLVREENI